MYARLFFVVEVWCVGFWARDHGFGESEDHQCLAARLLVPEARRAQLLDTAASLISLTPV